MGIQDTSNTKHAANGSRTNRYRTAPQIQAQRAGPKPKKDEQGRECKESSIGYRIRFGRRISHRSKLDPGITQDSFHNPVSLAQVLIWAVRIISRPKFNKNKKYIFLPHLILPKAKLKLKI